MLPSGNYPWLPGSSLLRSVPGKLFFPKLSHQTWRPESFHLFDFKVDFSITLVLGKGLKLRFFFVFVSVFVTHPLHKPSRELGRTKLSHPESLITGSEVWKINDYLFSGNSPKINDPRHKWPSVYVAWAHILSLYYGSFCSCWVAYLSKFRAVD